MAGVFKIDVLNLAGAMQEFFKLSVNKRVDEIARMLSGEIINKEAVANAKKMLDI